MLYISFYCRQSKVNKKGYSRVQLSLLIDKKRITINLPRQEKPAEFDKAMKSKKSNPIKDYCESVKARVDAIVQEMMEKNIPLNADTMKEYWERGGASLPYTLGDLWNEWLSVKQSELGTNIRQDTYDRYIVARDRFIGLIPIYAAASFRDGKVFLLSVSISCISIACMI